MRQRIPTCALAALMCLVTSAAWADGLIRDGIGPISTGRGGTNLGFADNAAIILDNPGSLVNIAGDGLLEIGVDTCICQVDYSNPYNDVSSKVRPIPMPVLGYIKKSADGRWAYGFGAFAPAGFGSSYGTLENPDLGPHLYRSIGGMAKALPAVAYKVNDQLSVGLTFGIAASSVNLDGPFYLQTGPLAGLPTIIDLQGFGVAPTGGLGFQYQLTEKTVIGGAYNEQTNFILRGPVHVTFMPPGGPPVGSNFDGKLWLKWPRSAALGIKHELCPHRRLSGDVIWFDWAHAFDEIRMEIRNPNDVVSEIMGNAGVSRPARDSIPAHWTDSVSMRLGYEWDSSDVNTWRAGYVYHASPVPDNTLNPYLDGVLTHAFSLGLSHKLPGGAKFNAAYQYCFGKQRYVADSSIIGGDFDDTSLSAQAHFAMLSLLWKL